MSGLANNGNGSDNVGEVTATMGFRNFDDRTRPFEREDLSQYILSGAMQPEEQSIVNRALFRFGTCVPATFAAGYIASGRLPWKRINAQIGITGLHRFLRPVFGMSLCVFPFVWVQQSFLAEIGELPMEFPLSFHIRRMLVTQRSAVMFGRSTLREVTRSEQLEHERVAIELQRESTTQVMGSAIDVNSELQRQVMLPIAQSGYKPMPKE